MLIKTDQHVKEEEGKTSLLELAFNWEIFSPIFYAYQIFFAHMQMNLLLLSVEKIRILTKV